MPHSPLISDLRSALGGENVLSAPSELEVYDCDAFVLERQPPEAVIFPQSTEQVAAAVKICRRHDIAIVPRAAGTSLAGGCVPIGRSVVLMLTRMNRILEINLRDRMAVVEPGVVNVNIAAALSGTGFHYAPDPSSQTASLIGGNAATNAGGPHTLKNGVTINHVLGVEAVLADGSIMQVGPPADPAGYDLLGLLVGSEGTLGVITKIWIRLTPDPQDYRTFRAIFDSVEDATNTASAIIAAGIIPAALELMDQGIMEAVEAAYHFGFPPDAAAVLIIEVDGPRVGLDAQESQIVAVCQSNHAREILQA
jgi:glycolate oxidase